MFVLKHPIEAALTAAVGRNMRAVFEKVAAPAKPADVPTTPAKPAKPAGAKTSQKTITEVANLPAVKTVLFGLDATILEVNESNEQ